MDDEIKKTAEEQEEQMIYDAFRKLLDTYLASNHRKKVDIITRAFNFAKQAHKGVRRLSGEPYIMHPIAVAQIVCEEIGMGSTSICAALLHDVEEDTDYTYEDIRNLFGEKIANIVEGLTKISGGIFGERASLQAETFKKLLLTMSDDIRVILIKISDRLHNMRTLESMRPSKQYKVAGETLYIYAPLAARLGLNKIKTELENLSFKYEHPDDFQAISEQLASTQAERDTIFQQFTPPIREALDKMGLQYEIFSRIKSPYSIWSKMQNKHVTFDEIFDILAIRIIFEPRTPEEEVNDCFNIYVALTKIYKSHPDRFRDWVNHPKANGYQALHVTLMSHKGEWIEVQIRSKRMNEIDEQGLAAHWKYKSNDTNLNPSEADDKVDGWLHTIKEILDDPQPDTLDLLDTIKLNLFAKEIIVFTPKGEIKSMPADATALDFAFSIHSFLGTHCIGAKVNHKLVPIMHTLKSGDQVEILTSRNQQVKHEWLKYVTTAKAKSKIQACLRKMDRELQQQGMQLLETFLQKKELEANGENINKLQRFHRFSTREQMLQAIARQELTLTDADVACLQGKRPSKGWRKFIPFISEKENAEVETSARLEVDAIDRKKVFTLTDANIDQCIIESCCHPIPGDDALGYINTEDNRLHIHKRNCPQAMKLKSNFGNNIVAVTWDVNHHLFETTVDISGIDEEGMLLRIAESLYNIDNIRVEALNIAGNDGIFNARLTIRVHNTEEVRHVCSALKQIDKVLKAVRFD